MREPNRDRSIGDFPITAGGPGSLRGRIRRVASALIALIIGATIGVAVTPATPAQALDIVQFISVNGRYSNAVGINGNTPPCLSYVPTPQSTVPTALNQVRFGEPANESGCGTVTNRSGFGFEGVLTSGLYGSLFELGRFTHYNNPIDADPSKVGTVDLTTTFTFRDLRDNSTFTIEPVYEVTLDETPNGANPCAYPDGPNQNGCADRVTIQQPTPITVNIGSTRFTIDVGGFGTVDPDSDLCDLSTIVTGNSILTPEGGTSEFCIFGTASKSTLVINKTSVGGNGAFDFRYEEMSQLTPTPQPTSPPRVFTTTVTTSGGSGTSGPLEVEPGVYTLSEVNVAAGVTPGALTCTSDAGPGEAYVTIAGTQYVDFDSGETITCSVTNTFNASITVIKDAVPNAAQDFSFTTTGGNGLPAAFQLDDDSTATLPNTQTFSVPAGNYTITEAANPANWSLQGLVCSVTNVPGDTATQSVSGATASIHVGPGDTATCTYTNRASARLRLSKQWLVGRNGDSASLTADVTPPAGVDRTFVSSATGANPQVDNDATFVTVPLGSSVALAETVNPAANYTSSLVCTDDRTGASISSLTTASDGRSGTLVTNASEAAIGATITCQFSNPRRQATLNLSKVLSPASDAGTFTLSIAGQAGGPATTTGGNGATTSATVNVGDSITVSEVGAGGTNLANYGSALVCTGPAGFTTINLANTTSNTFSVPAAAADGVINCTFANTRRSAQIRVDKQWVNARVSESVTISATGGTNNPGLASTANTANETDAGTPVTMYSGETLAFSETFGVPANAANYTTTLTCTGAADANPNDGLAIGPNDTNIVCTYRNERKSATFTLQKTWLNATQGEVVNLDADGSAPANGQIVDTTATAPAGAAATNSMTVYAGETVNFSESFQTTGNAANYDTTLDCIGATVAPGAGNRSGSYSVGTSPANVTCTFTNARKLSGVRVVKNWVDGRAGDQALLTATLGNTSDTDTSTAPDAPVISGDEAADNSVFVPAFAGDTVTFSEDLGANAALYDSTWSCRGGAATPGTSGSVLVTAADTSAVVCEITNTRRRAAVIVEKQTVPDGSTQPFGFDVSWSATDLSIIDGGSVMTQVLAGEQHTVTELGTDGWSLTGIVCTPSTNASVSVGTATATVTPEPGETIRCVFTNAQRGAVTVDKTVTTPVTHVSGLDYTATYQVQVDTASNIPEPFVLTDVPSFGTGTTITSTSAVRTSAGGPAANPAWNGGTGTPADTVLASGSINPGDVIIYDVTIGFSVSPTITSDARDCDTLTGVSATGTLNTATVEYGDDDSDTSSDCDVIPDPDISVVKTIPQGSELVRNPDGTWTVGYLLTVTNAGDGPGQYNLDDQLDLTSGVTVVGAVASVVDASITTADLDDDFDGITNTLLASDVPIEAVDQHTYRVQLTVAIVIDSQTNGDCTAQGGGGLLNTMTVTVDGEPIDASACAPFSILTLDKVVISDDGANAVKGDFELTATGPTPIDGFGSVTSAVLPGAYTLSEDGPDGFDTNGFVCDDVASPQAGWSTNVAAGARVTCVITNDDRPVDLQLTKSDGGAVAAAGGSPFDYTITVSNVGTRDPDPLEPVTVTDQLPAGLAWVGFPATCSQAGQTLTCDIDPALLTVGSAPVVIVASARALPDAPSGLYVNKAWVTTQDDPACVDGCEPPPPCPTQQAPNNNVDCEDTPVVRNGAVQIVKTDDVNAPVAPGDTYSYQLVVTNTGPTTLLPGLVVNDDLPADLTLVSTVGGAGWTCNSVDPIECTYAPSLAPGASAPTITVTVTVKPTATVSPIHNVAVVTAAVDRDCPVDMDQPVDAFEPACNQVSDEDDENTPISPQADLAILKSSSVDVVGAGGSFDWILDVVNNGPGVAINVEIGDIVPASVTVTGVNSAQFTCGFVGNTVTCTRPSMAVGEAGRIIITVSVPVASVGGTVVNVGTVEATTPDPNLTNNSDDDPVTVVAQQPPTTPSPPIVNPLPPTGSSSAAMIRVGILLTLLGGLTLMATRRRARNGETIR